MTKHEIRIRPVQETSRSDVDALLTWLTRERIVKEKLEKGELRVEQRATPDEHGTPMGLGTEIVLVVLQGVTGVVLVELLEQAKSAVREWQENRRSVGEDDPPDFDVTSDGDPR
ncbi:hypothetical protein ACFVZW_28260 [Streptomyces sp. NPDC059567]|uniref:hypothetical protein n=1 Tax=Streptomyces sp. NPDC059567 TaxID=3346867 RepID=UPI0036B4B34A